MRLSSGGIWHFKTQYVTSSVFLRHTQKKNQSPSTWYPLCGWGSCGFYSSVYVAKKLSLGDLGFPIESMKREKEKKRERDFRPWKEKVLAWGWLFETLNSSFFHILS